MTNGSRLFVRDEQRGDGAGVDDVHETATPDAQTAWLHRELRRRGDLLHSIVAVETSTVVGHAAFSRGYVDETSPIVVVGPVAVAPRVQGRGIGTAMMEEGISACRRNGEVAIFLLGDPAFYGRLGFSAEPAAAFDTHYAGDAFQALVLRPDALPPGGSLSYPAPFTQLP